MRTLDKLFRPKKPKRASNRCSEETKTLLQRLAKQSIEFEVKEGVWIYTLWKTPKGYKHQTRNTRTEWEAWYDVPLVEEFHRYFIPDCMLEKIKNITLAS